MACQRDNPRLFEEDFEALEAQFGRAGSIYQQPQPQQQPRPFWKPRQASRTKETDAPNHHQAAKRFRGVVITGYGDKLRIVT